MNISQYRFDAIILPTITLDFEMMTTRYVEDYDTPTTDTEYYHLNGQSGRRAIALPRDLLSSGVYQMSDGKFLKSLRSFNHLSLQGGVCACR